MRSAGVDESIANETILLRLRLGDELSRLLPYTKRPSADTITSAERKRKCINKNTDNKNDNNDTKNGNNNNYSEL